METIKCKYIEVELDDYSKLLLDEAIVLASLLDYAREEYISLMADDSFNCNFRFRHGSLDSYTLVLECEDNVVKKTRLYKHTSRSTVEERCPQLFGAIQKLRELL